MEVDQKAKTQLMSDVVLPFEGLLVKDSRLSKIFEIEQRVSKLRMSLAKISILILDEQIDAIEGMFKNAAKSHALLGIDKEIFIEYLFLYFDLLDDWMQDHFPLEYKNFNGYMIRLKDLFINSHDSFKEQEFLFVESEEKDSAVDSMHYDRSIQVDAKTFMQNNPFDSSIIEGLVKEFELLEEKIEIENEILEKIADFWSEYASFFDKSIEFKDLAYSLNILIVKIKVLDPDGISEKDKNFYKVFLNAVVYDLVQWSKEVVLEQSARDIHYLDASFLANIAQFELSFDAMKKEDKEDGEDDFELF